MAIGYWVAVAGLMLDIVGSLLLAKAVIVRKSDQIHEEATTRWSQPNWAYIESAVHARTDGWFAGGLLVTGFVFQSTGTLVEGNILRNGWIGWLSRHGFLVVLLTLAIIAAGVFGSWFRRKIWSARLNVIKRLHGHLEELYSNPRLPGDPTMLVIIEKRMKLSRQVNETDREYVKRALGLSCRRVGFPTNF